MVKEKVNQDSWKINTYRWSTVRFSGTSSFRPVRGEKSSHPVSFPAFQINFWSGNISTLPSDFQKLFLGASYQRFDSNFCWKQVILIGYKKGISIVSRTFLIVPTLENNTRIVVDIEDTRVRVEVSGTLSGFNGTPRKVGSTSFGRPMFLSTGYFTGHKYEVEPLNCLREPK